MRAYLDHNATTPLRAEARAAMQAAMDIAGNPSSVHAEGRAAKILMEKARAQVAMLVGCKPTQVVFTGSATEAAALAVAQKHRHGGVFAALPTEHDCLKVWSDLAVPGIYDRHGGISASGLSGLRGLLSDRSGRVERDDHPQCRDVALVAISAANSETGIMPPAGTVPGNGEFGDGMPYAAVADITQLAGKVPVLWGETKPSYLILSAHKLGGPKGVGAFINLTADDPEPHLRGGGQEMGRRAGTENIIGIAGFGAAATAAAQDVADGRWEEVAQFRNILETALEAQTRKTIFVGKDAMRLPNTSCIVAPGWKGETQVMQMDLAGFAISAGSACSSGKVRSSTVLTSMGFDDTEAACAIRVSLGLGTQQEDVLRFADAWAAKLRKHEQRAA